MARCGILNTRIYSSVRAFLALRKNNRQLLGTWLTDCYVDFSGATCEFFVLRRTKLIPRGRGRCYGSGMHTTNNDFTPAGEILSRDEAAQFLRISPATLCSWAATGTGPKFSRSGDVRGRALYLRGDLVRWVESRSVQPQQVRSSSAKRG